MSATCTANAFAVRRLTLSRGKGGIGGLLARSHAYQSGSGNFTNHNCYHADGNGNITCLVNSSQTVAASYRYDPYGNTISSSGTLASANVYRFSSKEIHVNSGMYYYGYRWYAPNLQRWLNRDPLGDFARFKLDYRTEIFLAANANYRVAPAEAVLGPNLYAFVLNDPLNKWDSFGLAVAGIGGGFLPPGYPWTPPGSPPVPDPSKPGCRAACIGTCIATAVSAGALCITLPPPANYWCGVAVALSERACEADCKRKYKN